MPTRARDLHAAVRAVDLYKGKADDALVREPKRLHAADGPHHSDDG